MLIFLTAQSYKFTSPLSAFPPFPAPQLPAVSMRERTGGSCLPTPRAFCSSLPPSAQGGGEGRSVLNKCIAGHQVCPPSTVSSLWKSGPLRAASLGSPGKWYLLHHRKNVPRRSLLQPLCHLRKGERLQHGGGSDSRPFPIRRIELL